MSEERKDDGGGAGSGVRARDGGGRPEQAIQPASVPRTVRDSCAVNYCFYFELVAGSKALGKAFTVKPDTGALSKLRRSKM